jgi:DNA-directed RNA polymerase specialized sigma subunit
MGRIKDIDELKQLRLAMNREKSRLEELRETLCTLGGNGDGSKVDGGKLNTTEDSYISIIDTLHNQEVAYNLITIKYYTLENRVYSNINKVGKVDELYALILYERFVKGVPIEELADRLGYSTSRYFQLRNEALKCYETVAEDVKEIEI